MQHDFGPGAAHASQGLSFPAFFSSLVVSLIIFAIQLTLFIVARRWLAHIYEPKTFLVPSTQAIDPPSASLFGWLAPLIKVTLDQVRETCTLDEYFFLRYICLLLFLFASSTCVILPILGSINWISNNSQNSDRYPTLDWLSWVNISPRNSNRKLAHFFLALIFISFILWLIYFELNQYISIRQNALTSDSHRQKASTKTVLLRSIPFKYQNEESLKNMFQIFPESVSNVWQNRDYTQLVHLINKQKYIASKLEELINIIVWKSTRNYKRKSSSIKSISTTTVSSNTSTMKEPKKTKYHSSLPGKKWMDYIKQSDIPKMRIPLFEIFGKSIFLPFCGPKIDALSWYKIELNRLNSEIRIMQSSPSSFPLINSCFVQFKHQIYAHLTCQSVIFDNPQLTGQSFIEIDPHDVIWDNLGFSWLQCFLRNVLATILNILLILGWTFPVALVAILSQLDYLPELFQGFLWIDYIPARFRIVISTILPSIIISFLMSLAPTIFQRLANIKGYASRLEVDMDVHRYLFAFTFIQVFLVVSLSRGMTAVFAHLLFSPLSAIALLASNIPKSANFFYSFIFLQGLSVSGSTFLQFGRIVKFFLYYPFIQQTPHQRFENITNIDSLHWGSVYPNLTCLAIIGIVYSIIAPLVTLFSTISFALFYLAYKYRVLYCNSMLFHTHFNYP